MPHRDGGGAALVAAKNCWRKGSTPAWMAWICGGMWQNDVASVSGPRGEIAPLSRHTHNMKGGPLNGMEVAGTSRSQYEWRVT